jgi:opacity protein-like surface antigen
MKQAKYMVVSSMLALLFSVSAFAADKNQHSVTIPIPVQVGNTQLEPGDYKVEWQGAGSEVQVNFLYNGKTVATVPGTFKANDPNVIQDDVVTDTTSANSKRLEEIDFRHNKESLVFDQSGM